ncbi:MAG: hypothetical protein EOP88_25260 [Verrucomicrobiaceae bacterium]|nr:MAG: hypothetical protein EOP88_25260 [Verrucomicrobiaceae bacterium]
MTGFFNLILIPLCFVATAVAQTRPLAEKEKWSYGDRAACVGENGRLTQTARVPSGGETPRDLCFSPSGKHLVVANQDSDRLTVFRVDHAAGTLSEPLQHFDIGTPLSVKLAAF